jgi:2-polyprenyl-6-methoxyphenol hydroxylase-like FAD-dependent oxidoreductase
MTEHAVVVAGGGPTGLMLAGELALAGVDVAIVERLASNDRASVGEVIVDLELRDRETGLSAGERRMLATAVQHQSAATTPAPADADRSLLTRRPAPTSFNDRHASRW